MIVNRVKVIQAIGVLNAIEMLAADIGDQDGSGHPLEIMVNHYANTREQGYHLRMWLPGPGSGESTTSCVSFSEHRSSDGIVVFYGNAEDFDGQTGIPCETSRMRKQVRFFERGDFIGAAAFILRWLTEGKSKAY